MDKMIMLNATMATKIGVTNELIVSDIMQSSEIMGESHDGAKWIKESQKELKADFPFLCVSTAKRHIREMMDLGLVMVGNYSKDKFDRSNWYAIDYNVYYAILEND